MTLVVQPAGLDATTAIWLQNSCTDAGTLLGVLFAIPTVDETASLEEFRAAYRDYYASLADTLMGMTQRMSVLDAPTIEGGQDLHDGYLSYLIQLADISGGGAIAIDDAPDADSIAAIVEQIQFETEQLGDSDLGLAEFHGAELQDLMTQVPACQELLDQLSGCSAAKNGRGLSSSGAQFPPRVPRNSSIPVRLFESDGRDPRFLRCRLTSFVSTLGSR